MKNHIMKIDDNCLKILSIYLHTYIRRIYSLCVFSFDEKSPLWTFWLLLWKIIRLKRFFSLSWKLRLEEIFCCDIAMWNGGVMYWPRCQSKRHKVHLKTKIDISFFYNYLSKATSLSIRFDHTPPASSMAGGDVYTRPRPQRPVF
jgi:hypothetical protein